MAIHPHQVATINEVFTPSADEIERARRIVDAFTGAGDVGVDAVALEPAVAVGDLPPLRGGDLDALLVQRFLGRELIRTDLPGGLPGGLPGLPGGLPGLGGKPSGKKK